MQESYLIWSNNKKNGPYSIYEIKNLISANQLAITDYYFDDDEQDWKLLIEIEAIKNQFKPRPKVDISNNNVSNSSVDESSISNNVSNFSSDENDSDNFIEHTVFRSPNSINEDINEDIKEHTTVSNVNSSGLHKQQAIEKENRLNEQWFLLRDKKYGPFTYFDLIKMLQEQNVFEYDFVWNKSMDQWKKISEIEGFDPQQIIGLKQKNKIQNIVKLFFRRKFKRVSYSSSIIVHNNKKVYKGNSLEICMGGAGITIETAELKKGEEIYIHFKPSEDTPAFNVLCEIVNKSKDNSQNTFRYGVKFLEINESTKEDLKKHIYKNNQAA